MKQGYNVAVACENFYHTEALDQCKNEEAEIVERIRHDFKLKTLEFQYEDDLEMNL